MLVSPKLSCRHFTRNWCGRVNLIQRGKIDKGQAGESAVYGALDSLKEQGLLTEHPFQLAGSYQLADTHDFPDLLAIGQNKAYLFEVRNTFFWIEGAEISGVKDLDWVNDMVLGKNWTAREFPLRGDDKTYLKWDKALGKPVRHRFTVKVPEGMEAVKVYVSTLPFFTESAKERMDLEFPNRQIHTFHGILPPKYVETVEDLNCWNLTQSRLTNLLRNLLEKEEAN